MTKKAFKDLIKDNTLYIHYNFSINSPDLPISMFISTSFWVLWGEPGEELYKLLKTYVVHQGYSIPTQDWSVIFGSTGKVESLDIWNEGSSGYKPSFMISSFDKLLQKTEGCWVNTSVDMDHRKDDYPWTLLHFRSFFYEVSHPWKMSCLSSRGTPLVAAQIKKEQVILKEFCNILIKFIPAPTRYCEALLLVCNLMPVGFLMPVTFPKWIEDALVTHESSQRYDYDGQRKFSLLERALLNYQPTKPPENLFEV